MTSTEAIEVPIGGDGDVLAELRGHVLIVTINRPDARNAVSANVTLGIGEALDYAEETTDVWVVILTGAGDKSFCAGQDLKEAAQGKFLADERVQRWGFAGFVQHAISKPVIAAVNGFALGGGTELVLASDLAVAADTSAFGLPEVKRGLVAAAGGAFRLGRQIPPKVAMEAMLTGQPISVERALGLGLVNRVVPRDQLLDEALALADAIMVNAPVAVQATKRIARGITDGAIPSEAVDWARTGTDMGTVFSSEDAAEGMAAFAQKRAPEWKGK